MSFTGDGQAIRGLYKAINPTILDEEYELDNSNETVVLNAQSKPILYMTVTADGANVSLVVEELPFDGDFGSDDVEFELLNTTVTDGNTEVLRVDKAGGAIRIIVSSTGACNARVRAIIH